MNSFCNTSCSSPTLEHTRFEIEELDNGQELDGRHDGGIGAGARGG